MINEPFRNENKVPQWAQGEHLVYNKKRRKRNNGSARVKQAKNTRLNRWMKSGINVGSLNIAGISMYKVLMILETHTFDVLCLQETWLTPSTVQLNIPGY
jgi:hypothetical protein